MTVILASASPRRQELLKKLFKDFLVLPSKFDESKLDHKDPIEFAEAASKAKAMDVAKTHLQDLVIGADTIVVIDNKILGKPKDMVDAHRTLKMLSGKTHHVITGVTLVRAARHVTGHVITHVTFRDLTDIEIEDYIMSSNVMDKAGSYAIQEIGDRFVSKVEGDRDNVVGLPVKMLAQMIRLFS